MKHELVKWLCIKLALAWSWFQTLVEPYIAFFLPKFLVA